MHVYLKIEIESCNASVADLEGAKDELVSVLRDTAEMIQNSTLNDEGCISFEGSRRDVNGNRIGTIEFEFQPDEEDK